MYVCTGTVPYARFVKTFGTYLHEKSLNGFIDKIDFSFLNEPYILFMLRQVRKISMILFVGKLDMKRPKK